MPDLRCKKINWEYLLDKINGWIENIKLKFWNNPKMKQYFFAYKYLGCPKKNAWPCFLAVTPFWKGLEIKVG